MLKLRRGVVVEEEPLTVEVEGERRPAWADEGLLGPMQKGDEVIVNTEALDLGLGSGGFDLVHVNLTRGLSGGGESGADVMKLNYSSIQHAVEPVERPEGEHAEAPGIPVLVIALHGQLAPAAWGAARQLEQIRSGLDRPEARIGYVQTPGGALPGALGRDVEQLRSQGLLAGHVTAGAAYGGELEAISVAGALDAADSLEWDAVIAGPGPGIIGSGTSYGHGGMAALDTAHAALALGMPTLLAPRLSEGDERERHRPLSHHTASVLELLLGEVEVPLPADHEGPLTNAAIEATGGRHRMSSWKVDLDGYAASGLPRTTMGRDLDQDRLFYRAALAAGAALAVALAG